MSNETTAQSAFRGRAAARTHPESGEVRVRVLPRGGGGAERFPLDVVFGLFLDQADTLEDVGDVVYPPLLHLQGLRRAVQIDRALIRLLDQGHELLRE